MRSSAGSQSTGPETVIIVHGIWMNGAETWLLARRLGACGFRPLRFSYPSLRSGVVGNAGRLARFVRAQGDAVVHLVGHSLGGLVILRALLDHPGLETGRVVLLGSPVNGSLTARRVQASRPTRWLLGRNADEGLLAEGVRWGGTRSLGVIAGTRPLGVGWLFGRLPAPHDGTVTVAETAIEAATSLTMDVHHTGLLFSAPVAERVCRFLHRGDFGPARPEAG